LDAFVYGKRFTAEEAKTCGIVDETSRPGELLTTSLAFIDAIVPEDGFSRDFVERTKLNLFEDVFDAPLESRPVFSSR
jgi:enoyl-CoA hydratase/carnithine racemase